MTPIHLKYRLQLDKFGCAEASALTEAIVIGAEQFSQRAVFIEQVAGEVDSGFTANAGAQKMASNSASESASGPRSRSFSRGRSFTGQSVMGSMVTSV